MSVTYLVGASVALLVFRGYYLLIEKASLIMIGAFTLFTIASLVALQTTDFAISGGELVSGLIPSIPGETRLLIVAMGAFGITGVGGDEIMAYNYWLIEKGYASYTGPRDNTPEWESRAKGWIRIMYWDALLSMVAYTAMTAMFYLLGAAVLNRQALIPDDQALIETLGNMYTESLGPWARTVFVLGAIVVLYSTLFAALAAWTRMFADAFGRIGWYDFQDQKSRRRAIAILAWLIPVGWATLFLFMQDIPGFMVILGGLATVFILLIVIFASLYFRYQHNDPRLTPSVWYDIWLWLSSIAIFLVALFALYKTFLSS
jgi:Mn2+/Fe2+ NRAMP family transporter